MIFPLSCNRCCAETVSKLLTSLLQVCSPFLCSALWEMNNLFHSISSAESISCLDQLSKPAAIVIYSPSKQPDKIHFKELKFRDFNDALWTNPNKAKGGQLFNHAYCLPLACVQPHAFSVFPKTWRFPTTCREMSAAEQLHRFKHVSKWHAEQHGLGKFMKSHF